MLHPRHNGATDLIISCILIYFCSTQGWKIIQHPI